MFDADFVLWASMQTHISGLSMMSLAIGPSKTARGETKWKKHPLYRAQTTQTHSNCHLSMFLSWSNAKLDMHKYPQTPSAGFTFSYADGWKQPCAALACLHFSVAAAWDCCQKIKWQNVGIISRGKHWLKNTPIPSFFALKRCLLLPCDVEGFWRKSFVEFCKTRVMGA